VPARDGLRLAPGVEPFVLDSDPEEKWSWDDIFCSGGIPCGPEGSDMW
jgi:hypothetical protein